MKDKTITLKIFTTKGQEKFNFLSKQYFTGINGLLLVYDITNKSSFDKLDQWCKHTSDIINTEKTPIILLGNKKDLDNRIVPYNEGKRLSILNNFSFLEISALNNENVEKAFNTLINKCIDLHSYQVKEDEEHSGSKKRARCF